MQQASTKPVMGAGPGQSSFGPAFLFLNRKQRRALGAFYSYARAVDDIADNQGLDRETRRGALAAWRAEIEDIFCGRQTSAAQELREAVAAFPLLKKEHFTLLLDGMGADLDKAEYATLAELEDYMYMVASSVGLACLAIFGYEDAQAGQYARNLGYAVQLTNIIRDAAADAQAGRFYIPAEDLRRFGCGRAELLAAKASPGFTALMEFEAGRAEGYYAKAQALINPAGKNKLLCALAMAGLYKALLRKTAASGFKSAGGRIRLGRLETAAALYGAWRDYAQI